MPALRPWHQVAVPQKDLRQGIPLDAQEFAIHLDQVIDGRAPRDYRDPERFFARTYLTDAFRKMAAEVAIAAPLPAHAQHPAAPGTPGLSPLQASVPGRRTGIAHHPGSTPLDDALCRAAVFEQLGEEQLEAAVLSDIAREGAHAARLDAEVPETIQRARLHQQVATVVFFE